MSARNELPIALLTLTCYNKAEHRAAHDDGELATAKGAAATSSLMVVSSSATTALEDVAAVGGPGMGRWFQLSLSSRKVPKYFRDNRVFIAYMAK